MKPMVTAQRLSFHPTGTALRMLAIYLWVGVLSPVSLAQTPPPSPLQFHVAKPAERLDMTVNTSRILTLDNKVPRLFVADPNLIQATPLSPNQIQISALKPGVTQLNLWDEKGAVYAVDVTVMRNAAELIDLLKTEFPEASLHVRLINADTVYIKGFVPETGMMDEIINLTKGHYRNVVNGLTVGGVQQVALHVKVMEISRSKLRQLGLDWEVMGNNFSLAQGAGGILAAAAATSSGTSSAAAAGTTGADTIRLRVFKGSTDATGFLQALRQYDLAKLLAEPTLTTMTGRAASFNCGGKIPVLQPSSFGATTVDYKDYGTRVDFLPRVLGNGMIRLDVRPSVTDVDDSRGIDMNGVRVPALTERFADTSVELRAGQTLALAGLIQNRVESQNKGVPFFADLPWVGRAFSRVQEHTNEIELLIMVTPEIIAPLDPHQVPRLGPGQSTSSPSDRELYSYGYLEVPNCRPDNHARENILGPPSTGPKAPIHSPQPAEQIPSQPYQPDATLPAPMRTTPNSAVGRMSGPGIAAPADTRPAETQRPTEPVLLGPLGYDPVQ